MRERRLLKEEQLKAQKTEVGRGIGLIAIGV